jgi:hypothetical protein
MSRWELLGLKSFIWTGTVLAGISAINQLFWL